MSAVTLPDEKIALRNYLETHPAITEILGTSQHRVVLTYDDVKDTGHWIVLTRAGGAWDTEVPLYRPIIYMVAYGNSPLEAVRVMNAASNVLGITDPTSVPQIHDNGVIISDILPTAGWTEDWDESLPGGFRMRMVLQPIELTVHRE